MGFLAVNTEYPVLRGWKNSNKRRKVELPPPKVINTSLETLPAELLSMIFVQSQNLNFPETSLKIAGKLKYNFQLAIEVICGLKTPNNELDVKISTHPFVTAELLRKCEPIEFIDYSNPHDMHLPFSLEEKANSGDLRAQNLVEYMITKRCKVENSAAMFAHFARRKKFSVCEALADLGQRTCIQTIRMALSNRVDESLVFKLLKLAPEVSNPKRTKEKIEVLNLLDRFNLPALSEYLYKLEEREE